MNAPHTPADIPGYDVVGLLGEGSMGSVYRACQRSTGQWVAIKMLRMDARWADAKVARLIARFERETSLCALLHHPHIVRLLDKGALDQRLHYAVFDYLPGTTLRDLVVERGPLEPTQARHIMLQVLDALACAHAQGIVHRDIKPQNIMVDGVGAHLNATIVDFGIGTLLSEYQPFMLAGQSLTQEAVGTPSYCAPEQLRGEPPTPRTDLYAWGLVFVKCLTGRPVFHGQTLAEVYHAQLSPRDVPLPAALVGHPLHALLRKVLAKAPGDRWPDAATAYRMLSSINVANIVGSLSPAGHPRPGGPAEAGAGERTWVHEQSPARTAFEKRQITALYCGFSIDTAHGVAVDLEFLEALQRDHLSTVADIAHRFGGHLMGTLASATLFYFGYPQIHGRDGQRAAQAALELMGQTQRKAKLLGAQGIRLAMSIGMHVGDVLLTADMLSSQAASRAQHLQHTAPAGHIHLSQEARCALARFVECRPLTDDARPQSQPPSHLLIKAHNTDGFCFLGQGMAAMAGRQAELQALKLRWQGALANEGGATLLTGEAGVGKSRLLFEWASTAEGMTLSSACSTEHQHAALHPILHWVRQHFELGDATLAPSGIRRLRDGLDAPGIDADRVTALLLSWMSISQDDAPPALAHYSPEMQRQWLLEALERLVLSMARQGAVRLVLEDIHWVDPSSAAFLDRLIPKLRGTGICLVMTARSDELAWVPQHDAPALHLAGLDGPSTTALLETLLDGHGIEPAAAARIHEHTAGIPLYVEELVAFLRAQAMLTRQHHTAFVLAAPLTQDAVPRSLRDTLGHTLHRIGPAKETAQLASALGREFDHALLAEVSLCDEATLQAHLRALLEAGVILPCPRVENAHYIFKHSLLRSAAYDTMPKGVREATHAGIASAMESRTPEEGRHDLSTLARHHAAAAQFERAVHHGVKSVERMLQRALHDDALDFIATVTPWLDKLAKDDNPAPSLSLRRLKVSALMSKHGWAHERVRTAADEAHQLAARSGDAHQVIPVLWSLATYHHVASNRPVVRDMADQLLAHRAQGHEAIGVPALAISGVSAWIDGNYGRAQRQLSEAMTLPRQQNHASEATHYGLDCGVWAQAALANVSWFGSADGSLAHRLAAQAVDQAQGLDHVPSLGIALMYQSFVHQYAGDVERTADACARLGELGRKHGLPAYAAYATIVHSWASASLTQATQTIEHLRQLGCMLGQTYFHALMADVQLRHGRPGEALALCAQGLSLCDQLGERYYAPELLRLQAKALVRQGFRRHRDEVKRTLARAATLANQMQMVRSMLDAQSEMAGLFH